ncbi:hypothetical protein BsWGS_25244 [Bradybaena similaris]
MFVDFRCRTITSERRSEYLISKFNRIQITHIMRRQVIASIWMKIINTPTRTRQNTPTRTRQNNSTRTGQNTPTRTRQNTSTRTRQNTTTWTRQNTPTRTRQNTPTRTRQNTPTIVMNTPRIISHGARQEKLTSQVQCLVVQLELNSKYKRDHHAN